ncbi:MAG: response regulator transcription factor [Mycobacterium kyogaense]|uniref:response regulator transcription factor n=1 Tax=Mycobacterium kyogaense TaxID=2212479 RepID=UPI002FFAE66F
MATSVLIADDQRLIRAGLRMLCDAADDIVVIGEAADGAEAVRQGAELQPDVILMDLRMPGVDGIIAVRQVMAARATAKVLVLTTFDDDDHLYPALAAGAAGFLVKDTGPAELLGAIRRIAAGDFVLSPHLLQRLVSRAVEAGAPQDTLAANPLTAREHDVLRLVVQGLSNQDIADSLHLGVTTVKTHVSNAAAKLGARNRVQLAVYGYQLMA